MQQSKFWTIKELDVYCRLNNRSVLIRRSKEKIGKNMLAGVVKNEPYFVGELK